MKKIFKLLMQEVKIDLKEKFQEPRKGLRSGHIKNSLCIPFNECLNERQNI